jgi:hypothetical protein
MPEHPEWDELVNELARIEERLRDLAFDRLREAAAGDEQGAADEKRLSKARRGVERAILALGGRDDEFGD